MVIANAQFNCDKSYERTPRFFFVPGIDTLSSIGRYAESIAFIKCDTNLPLYISSYRLAANYAQLGFIDSAYFYLERFLDQSPDDRIVVVDYRFEPLKKDTSRWYAIVERIEQGYLGLLSEKINEQLALKLFYMGINDQRYRAYVQYANPDLQQCGDEFYKKSKELQAQFVSIIQEYGFPTFTLVGRLGCSSAFYVYQHLEPALLTKYYKLIRKAYKDNDMFPDEYAMATDRFLLWKNRRQLYGTQFIRSNVTEKYFPDATILYPVKNFQEVNHRRQLMGIQSTVEEVAEKHGYIIPIEYYSNTEKMKWVR